MSAYTVCCTCVLAAGCVWILALFILGTVMCVSEKGLPCGHGPVGPGSGAGRFFLGTAGPVVRAQQGGGWSRAADARTISHPQRRAKWPASTCGCAAWLLWVCAGLPCCRKVALRCRLAREAGGLGCRAGEKAESRIARSALLAACFTHPIAPGCSLRPARGGARQRCS